MKNICQLCLLSVLLLQPSNLSSFIRECASIQEVIPEASPGTFVVFDIDNTLLRPRQMLGSDEWFKYYLGQCERQFLSHEEAFNHAVDILHGVYSVTRVQPMEECTAKVVRTLQSQGVKIIALTARSPSTANVTIRQLASIGIDMSVTAPSQVCFPLIDVSEALFYHGVLFTEGKSKKNALSAFFRQLSWTPKKILFIDDKKQMLDDMSTYEQEGVEFVGLRFSGADACVKALDPKICDVELEAFSNLMSDAQAREYAQTR